MRKFLERSCSFFAWLSTFVLLASLCSLLFYLLIRGWGALNLELIFDTVAPLDAILGREQVFDGLFPAIVGTISLVLFSVVLAVPIGVAAGVYMAEYAVGQKKRIFSLFFDVLAALPSVVIGLAGFSVTVLLHRLLPNRVVPCLFLSALALSFLVLPYLVRTTQMALEAVPSALRQTAPALGATKVQNIIYVLVPHCLSDISSGIVLAIGRAAEDTAVIMLTGVVVSAGIPRSIFEQYEALPFYIYYISSQYTTPQELQKGFAAAILLLSLCGTLFMGTFLVKQLFFWKIKK